MALVFYKGIYYAGTYPMNAAQVMLPSDDTLTPQNANKRGYRWVCDVAYEENEVIPPDMRQHFQQLREDGYLLGVALHPVSRVDKGLYEPLGK
jgi:hypothetical protein